MSQCTVGFLELWASVYLMFGRFRLAKNSTVWVLACLLFATISATVAQAETLDWGTRPATNLRTGGTDAPTYGAAPTLLTVTTSGGAAGGFDGAGPNTLAIEPTSSANGFTGYVNSIMNASIDDETSVHTTTINFTEPVYNASLTVGDIDGGPTFSFSGAAFNDIVEFRATDATGATILPTSGTPATALVTWNAGTGRALSTNQNISDASGNVLVSFAGPIRTLTIRHISGANSTTANPTTQFVFIETVNFTRSPQLTISKTSNNGVGPFNFDRSNVLNAGTTPFTSTTNTSTITTTVAGTAVSGTPVILYGTNIATTITETGATPWVITSSPVVCTDSNSAVSTNPATFNATLAGYVATIAATNIRPGAVISCAVVNDKKPVLSLVKTVTNDNGGTAVVGGFTLAAAGPTPISGASGTAAVTSIPVVAGAYTLSETGPTGYTAGAWSCTAGSVVGSVVTLSNGQTAICTINNNDIQPRLTLVKTVTNDNGGTAAVSGFTLIATGPTTISGVSASAAVTNAGVNAGTYVLSETGPAGYTAGAWSCTAGTLAGSNLTLAVGQIATCTINNNDTAPVLTLVKTVTDFSGGPSTVSSFTLTATGPVTISGVTGSAAVTNAAINAGTYALSEAGPAGYTAGSWSCTAGTLAGSNLTLTLGQTASCTINNVKLPTMTLRKTTNGSVGTFNFTGTNGVPNQNITTTIVGTPASGSTSILTAAATSTQFTENLPGGTPWEITTHSCTGMGAGGTASLAGNVVTLDVAATAAGSNIVCTITNRRRPLVSVQKITTGGTGGPFSFADMNLTGTFANISTILVSTATPTTPTSLIATATGTAVVLTESFSTAWKSSGVTCTDNNASVTGSVNPVATSTTGNITIPNTAIVIGADINCVFSNAAAAPSLTILKTANTAGPVSRGNTITYTYRVTNSGNVIVQNVTIADSHAGFGTDPVPSGEAVLMDVSPLGDTTDAGTNATWDNLGPGDSVTFTGTYVVVQADIDNLQ